MPLEADSGVAGLISAVAGVRLRPSMYVGSTGEYGAAHLFFELVSNSLAEYFAGFATALDVRVDRTGMFVADDGRGIPVDEQPGFLQTACTSVNSDPDRFRPTIHVSTFGLGLGVVSALSSVMVVTVDRRRRYQQVFSRGCAVTALTDTGPALGRGTTVYLVPDGELFGEAVPTRSCLARMRELAVLNPGLALSWSGRRLPAFGGLAGFARHLARTGAESPRLVADVTAGVNRIEIAVVWRDDGAAVTRGFVNQLQSTGSHVKGLLRGLAGTREEGRVALVAVTTPVATFVGRTMRDFQDKAIASAVRRAVKTAHENGSVPMEQSEKAGSESPRRGVARGEKIRANRVDW